MKRMRWVVVAFLLTVLSVHSASAQQKAKKWVMIDGTEKAWWIDVNKIELDKDMGATFYYYMTMSSKPGVTPDIAGDYIPAISGYINDVNMAINCTTGEEYVYSRKQENWLPDREKWPPEYHTSVRRIVCGDAKTK
jgi:hypothetical protein